VRLVRLLHLDDAEHDDPDTCPNVEVLALVVQSILIEDQEKKRIQYV
jgi:hypothetical protein